MRYVGNIIYDEILKKDSAELVIFGAGKTGRKIYAYLEMNDLSNKLNCFCDMNKELWGQLIDGVMIKNPEDVLGNREKYHFLTGGRYADEILEILQERGIQNVHLLLL